MSKLRRLIATSRHAWTLPAAFLLLLPAAAAAANLASLTVNPAAVVSGSRVEVTIALDTAAPPGGAGVTVTISDPGILNAQGTYTVAEGATSTGFTADTGAVGTPTQVTLQSSYEGVTKTATLMVTPRSPVRGLAGDLWADVVLGKSDFTEIVPNEVTSRRLFNPGGVLVDRSVSPNRVYVYDSGNSRVLGLSHLGTCGGGTKSGQNCTANSDCPGSTCAIEEGRGADLVLGQPSFDRSACNGDSALQGYPVRAPASAATLCGIDDGLLSPLETGSRATMAVDSAGNLYVPDFENHRVLRYNSPFTTDTIADDVWGQADFTGNECNRGRGLRAPDNQSLCLASPYFGVTAGVGIDSVGNLWVADVANHRVLRFPFVPATGSPRHTADLVLGQPDFSSFNPGPGLHQMWSPSAVRVDGAGSVYVAEYSDGAPESENNRVLIFDPPFSNGMTARKLDYPFYRPESLEFDPAGNLWVNDYGNTQLLLFVGGAVQKVLLKDLPASDRRCGSDNTTGDRPPFTYEGNGGDPFYSWNLCGVGGSIGVDSDGNVLLSAIHSQDVWRFPAPIPAPAAGIAHSADARIFKPYQWAIHNEVGLAGIYGVSGLAVAAGQLIVADNRRLLFWNDLSNLSNGKAADGFVGQADPRGQGGDYFGRIREDGGSRLWAIRYDEIQVYSLPLTTGASPVTTIAPPLPVLGGGSLTWDGLLTTGGLAPVGTGQKVWIADPTHNRVFRIRDPLTSPVVDIVLGQTNVSGTDCNQGRSESSPSRDSLCHPGSVVLDPLGNLYVSETALESNGNFRLLEYDAGLFPESPASALFAIPASRVFGTGGSFTEPNNVGGTCSHNGELCPAFWEPTFDPQGRMVAGENAYLTSRFPAIYTNPQANQHVSGYLNDYYSMGYAATFDSSNNLYVGDLNWDRVLMYRNPFSSLPLTLTVTKAGGGSGTVTSVPAGIDCGAACSSSYGVGTVVTLTATPAANSIFGGWSEDPDCSDGVVTMDAARNCTATFTLAPDLIVSAFSAPTTGAAGLAISVTSTTKNQTGTSPAPASTTKFYLSTDATLDAGDTLLGSRAIPTLGPGAISSGSTSLTIPAGTTGGNYFVIAKADADNLIFETVETNNTASDTIVIGPDLIVSALTAPSAALAGSTISVTDTTKNQTGTSPAPVSTTRFYLSTNTAWDAADTLIGSRSIPALAAGASNSGSANVTIPGGTATGNYYVIAKADGDGSLFEVSETNNTKYASIRISPPDLIVSANSVPKTGGAGLTIVATNTTKNQTNTGPAPASTTKFYLSTNAAWDAGDILLGSQAIGALAPGASEAHSTTLTIPAGTTPGTKYVIAKADADGLISETLETNNTASDTIVIGPDLIVSALTVPTTGGAGLPITIIDTTKNQGGGFAPASTTSFYLSTNTTLGAGDVLLGSRGIPALDPNVANAGSTSVTIPAGTAVGSYYILAIADGPNAIPETVETNNNKYALIKLSPDLIVSALGAPTSARVGTAITVTDTTKNQGLGSAVATTTSFYLSTNATYEAGDVSLGSRAVPILASAATNPGSTSVTIPAGTAPGAYYILARADDTGAVAETSETNNVTRQAITITP